MDYEKAYKAALTTAKQWIKDGSEPSTKKCLELLFPELAESEDERIRKEIIGFIQSQIEDGNSAGWDRWISWLEKQKEQDEKELSEKIAAAYQLGRSDERKQKEQKPAESTEDERIRRAIVKHFQRKDSPVTFSGVVVEDALAWLEKQKDMVEALRMEYEKGRADAIAEMKEQKPTTKFKKGDWVVYDGVLGHGILQVADVKDGRYTFVDNESTLLAEDSDDCLRPLTPKDLISYSLILRSKSKSYYGEELLRMRAYLDLSSNEFEACMLRYFHSAANRKDDLEIVKDTKEYAVQLMKIAKKEQKPAEWSEEDEKMLKCCLIAINHYEKTCNIGDHRPTKFNIDGYLAYVDKVQSWLKSLRPSWKPSEEQMNALNFAVGYLFSTKQNPTYLRDLYDDLLKLKQL